MKKLKKLKKQPAKSLKEYSTEELWEEHDKQASEIRSLFYGFVFLIITALLIGVGVSVLSSLYTELLFVVFICLVLASALAVMAIMTQGYRARLLLLIILAEIKGTKEAEKSND